MGTERLDLLADGSPVRDEVRGLLAGWELGELAAIQDSATGYPDTIWEAFRRRIGPRLTEPAVVCVALEELGAARCPLPVHAGLVQPLAAALALGAAGHRLRDALLEGGDRYALARPGPADRENMVAEREGGRWRLSGRVRNLTYGDTADILLVPARHGASGLMLAVVPAAAPGVRRITRPTLTSDRLTDLEFDEVALDQEVVLAGVADAVAAAEVLGTVAVAAELVGMSAALLSMATDRVKSRHAYGAPLAALQGVQLRAADLYLSFLAAREAVAEAASVLASGAGPEASAHVLASLAAAKVTATESALAIAAGAHQLCGGWGLLDAAGLHHFTRAIKAAESQLGSSRYHRRTIAAYLKA